MANTKRSVLAPSFTVDTTALHQCNTTNFVEYKKLEHQAASAKPRAASSKPQAPSSSSRKQQASSVEQQAASDKPRAASCSISEPR